MIGCHPVLPTIYGEALSYEEQICKLLKMINDALKEIDDIPETIERYVNSEEFQAWLHTQVTNILSGAEFEIPLKMFGAVGDGVTDDTAAFVAAFTVASQTVEWITPYYWSNHTIKVSLSLGNGRFLITKDNVFALAGTSAIWGLMIRGNGPFVSQLLYCPRSDNDDLHYYYKQVPGIRGLIAPSFQNMGFIIGPEYNAHFFYLASTKNNTSQGWYFNNCIFIGNENAVLLTVTGDPNDSEIMFVDCRVREVKHVYYSDGSYENLFCTFTNTHLEHVYDDAFVIRTASSLSVSNCSMLFSDTCRDGAAVVRMAGRTITGGTFLFSNLRVELHGNSIVYNEDTANSPALIHFDSCRLGVVYTAGPKVIIHNNSYTSLLFDNCYIGCTPYGDTTPTPFVSFIGRAQQSSPYGSIVFNNCTRIYQTNYYYDRSTFNTTYENNMLITVKNCDCIDVSGLASRQGNTLISHFNTSTGYNRTVFIPSSVIVVYCFKLLSPDTPPTIHITAGSTVYTATYNEATGLYYLGSAGGEIPGGTWSFSSDELPWSNFGLILFGRL